MMQKIFYPSLAALAAVALLASTTQAAVIIPTLLVGNAGNAADVAEAGDGAVAYEYSIAKYEVTAGQYTEMLNAVAATDIYFLYDASMGTGTHRTRITQSSVSRSFTQLTPNVQNTIHASKPNSRGNGTWSVTKRHNSTMTYQPASRKLAKLSKKACIDSSSNASAGISRSRYSRFQRSDVRIGKLRYRY